MKIGLIRHFRVNKPFLKGIVSQSETLIWLKEYEASSSLIITPTKVKGHWEICYSSCLTRAVITAKKVYGNEITCQPAFNEPSGEKIFRKNIRLPFLLWATLIRFAIVTNHKSQSNGKRILTERIEAAIDMILSGSHETF